MDSELSCPLNFAPTSRNAGKVILIGSSHGALYEIFTVLEGIDPVVRFRNLTSSLVGSFFAEWRPFAVQVEAIVCDESTEYVVALYRKSQLRFYHFSDGMLAEVSKFEKNKNFLCL
jgi:hypothetical protein